MVGVDVNRSEVFKKKLFGGGGVGLRGGAGSM